MLPMSILRRGLAIALGCLLLAGGGAATEVSVARSASGSILADPIQLTRDPANHLRPAWSPDGARLAFQSNSGGVNHIWIINADGSGQRQLTEGPGDDRRPAWSPDGARLAFDSLRKGTRDIWMVNADGSGLRQLTSDPGEESFASWSPDGAHIAYYSYQDGVMDIWVAGLKQAAAERLTRNLASIQNKNCTFGCHAVSWNGNGTRIAYTGGDHKSIWVMNVDGSDQRRVTEHDRAGHYHFPVWREDGRLIVVSEEVGEKVWSDVWTMTEEGADLDQLYTRIEHGGPFAWSPDGSHVAFHSPRTGFFQIYVSALTPPGVGRLPWFRELASLSSATPQALLLLPVILFLAGAAFLGWRLRFARGRSGQWGTGDPA